MIRVILSDVHFPFQDTPLLALWLKELARIRPDGVDIMGDLIDCYSLSRFDKNPLRKASIQAELDQATCFLDLMMDCLPKGCDVRYCEGNHENRLHRMLWGKAKELAHIRNLSIPKLLGLEARGIKYYTPEKPYRIGGVNGLWYIHGDLARKCNWGMTAGGMGARAVCQRIQANVIMGHTHQMGFISFRGWDQLNEGYEVGCLCRFDLEYIVGVPQWQQGWAVVEYPPEGGYEVQFVRVLNKGKRRIVVAGGKVIATLPPAKRHM